MEITKKDIFNALVENDSLEADGDKNYYYIHLDEEKIHLDEEKGLVDSVQKADISFRAEFSLQEDDSYDWENEDNEEFMEVVNDLYDQLTAYLS